MVKYEISFDFDFEDDISYDEERQTIEIKDIKDDCFKEMIEPSEKIKEFEDWYNTGASEDDEDRIKILDLKYDNKYYDEVYRSIYITLEKPLINENEFAKEIVDYLFDTMDYPILFYHVTGTTYEDYWDYRSETPEQRTIPVDYDDSENIRHYTNLKITKL